VICALKLSPTRGTSLLNSPDMSHSYCASDALALGPRGPPRHALPIHSETPSGADIAREGTQKAHLLSLSACHWRWCLVWRMMCFVPCLLLSILTDGCPCTGAPSALCHQNWADDREDAHLFRVLPPNPPRPVSSPSAAHQQHTPLCCFQFQLAPSWRLAPRIIESTGDRQIYFRLPLGG
jgi:hypothetical protein